MSSHHTPSRLGDYAEGQLCFTVLCSFFVIWLFYEDQIQTHYMGLSISSITFYENSEIS
jgi:hypothetical protein